jgi:hypothetical protein
MFLLKYSQAPLSSLWIMFSRYGTSSMCGVWFKYRKHEAWIFDLALLRFGKRYSQKCSLFSKKRISVFMYLALFLKNEINTAHFGVLLGLNTLTVGLWLWERRSVFADFLHRPAFPVYFAWFLLFQISSLQHIDFTTHFSCLKNTNWPLGRIIWIRT